MSQSVDYESVAVTVFWTRVRARVSDGVMGLGSDMVESDRVGSDGVGK